VEEGENGKEELAKRKTSRHMPGENVTSDEVYYIKGDTTFAPISESVQKKKYGTRNSLRQK